MSQAMVAIPLATGATATVRVSNIPPSAIASELLAFFDSAVAAAGAAFACKIVAAHRGWLSRGYGTVQFDSSAAAILAADLASSGRLPPFLGSHLSISPAHVDILPRAPDLALRFAGASLILGNRVVERELEVAYTWDGVRAEIILAKRRVDLYLEHDSRKYKLEVLFEDIRECFGCSLDETGAILLQLTYAPRIHTVISGPVVDSRFTDERFFACKEDNKFAWEAYTLKISKNALQSSKSKDKGKLMKCYRIHITPSKIYCLGPVEEVSNYVVKYHSEYASDFVRVTFVDEDWSKLSSNALSPRTEKECIRRWMGHFEDIRSVSKCAARMGQLFSSSRPTFEISSSNIEVIPDVEATTDGTKNIFSDGIGRISLSFARRIAKVLGLDSANPPSAFQIRFGGYKGVIAVDPTSFFDLSLRPSMKKFESQSSMLNITSWSKSQPCYVNREIISLLSTLGIRDETFESMQQDDMHEADEMLTNKEAALSALGKIGGAETKRAVKMLLQGYEPSSEPYLLMILKAHRANRLTDIRTRCKIHVPKGRVLIGCLDETGKLDYGQVYIRVTKTQKEQKDSEQPFFYDDDDGETAVIVGKVAVSKNPCLHPGDIRVLEAVYDSGLDARGLVDCVVFPQRGERPHPNECSGGDLDGDLFFITWDDKLIPEKVDAPMDYAATRPRIMDHVVTLENLGKRVMPVHVGNASYHLLLQEIQKNFVDYMINDTLGAISTAHLIHADRNPLKARSPECLQLAALHSMAVDFAKTGAPAEMPQSLRPREYPDFMERWEKPMYVSNGPMGKLYRAALLHAENSDALLPEAPASRGYDPDLEVPGFREFLDAAEECYELYAEKLGTLMSYYSAETEDEILTGNIRNKQLYLKRDNKRYFDMKDRIVAAVDALHDEVRGWLRECRDASRMASAWYHVTYHPDRRGEKRLWSFPWVACDNLLAIKEARGCRRRVDDAVPMDCDA
ncbi:hypothetical protein PR202_ga20020 [Eleusine coracana subsp. coracana]|uniref:RNA-dependent RNA polymerase n=1 Tax=Eleusine coracana subsp. coracana TaxID=191504 RepID=A0AAV5CXM5_ELECO|nr:hypothetical protein PR202_ga20020 [Eleusine coracana subsp. coracana]